jgi:hypothetical protein
MFSSNIFCFMRVERKGWRGGVFGPSIGESRSSNDSGLQFDGAKGLPRSSSSQSIVRQMGVIICKGSFWVPASSCQLSQVSKTRPGAPGGRISQGKCSNVIVLSKCLRRASDCFCRLGAERSRSLKAEQCA